MSGRRVAIAVALATLAVAVVFVGSQPRSGGPYDSTGRSWTTGLGLAAGQSGSWGAQFPINRTGADIVLEDVRLVGVHGLEVLGVNLLTTDENRGLLGSAMGYPPDPNEEWGPWRLRPLAPTRIASTEAGWGLVVGVRLTGAGDGRIDNVSVVYTHGRTRYETTLNQGLEVTYLP